MINLKLNEQVKGAEKEQLQEIPLELQIPGILDMLNKLYETNLKSRIAKYGLQGYFESDNLYEQIYAINKIVTDGKGIDAIPNEDNVYEIIENINKEIAENLARRYVMNKIEKEVEALVIEKQNKYFDEVRLGIIKKQKGPENGKTLKKLADLENLEKRKSTENIQGILRPAAFSEIIGQERAIKALISKLASPYPQHIILYGPPGVGKTTAARLALEEVKGLAHTPFDDNSKFVEVDGTTLRWDPREITNPLLGSVHDPIYQGSKRDLAEGGIPEPKPGLVTEAHGGVLFIDEIGELDNILQNKLLKVLEDKRVEFSSAYYDPDDENTPKYVKYLFDKGAPADFVLIGATTREPAEINPALRSRCTEVFFEPLTNKDVENIVLNACDKLKIKIAPLAAQMISRHTVEGRKAVNILADVYGAVIYKNQQTELEDIYISEEAVEEVLALGRHKAYEELKSETEYEVGKIYGLGVSGYMGSTIEIEAAVFQAKEGGHGQIRFNDTAGSMAKDSVFNAASVIRKLTGIDIKDYDIHVNVIGGGNIDGPSAGAAITLCIISALQNKPLRQDIAVTGEISLRGKIKPVGGIFEKVYGARRRGINTVFIPEDNAKEKPSGLSDIEIKSVATLEELMEQVYKK